MTQENKAREDAWDRYSKQAYEDDCAPYKVIYHGDFEKMWEAHSKEVAELKALIIRASFLFNDNLENIIITSESKKWLNDMEQLNDTRK